MEEKPVLKFKIETVRPDIRAFRQNSIEVTPVDPLYVAVPVEAEDVHAVSDVNGAVILNLEGYVRLHNRFEEAFQAASPESQDDGDFDEVDWEDEDVDWEDDDIDESEIEWDDE